MPSLRALFVAIGGSLCVALPAQDLRWQIPPRGVVEYARTDTSIVVAPPSTGKGVQRVIRPKTAEWRFVESDVAEPFQEWFGPSYDDSGWNEGVGEFRDRTGTGIVEWRAKYVCARTRFTLRQSRVRGAVLNLTYDDRVVVWLNGVEIYKHDTYTQGKQIVLDARARRAFRRGENVLAVRCHNTGGAAALVVGLNLLDKKPKSEKDALNRGGGSAARGNQVSREVFPTWRAPALLFEGELDSGKSRIVMPPTDLRELGRFVALDLKASRSGRSYKEVCPRMAYFGDVRLRGKIPTLGADGRQTIVVRVQSGKNELRGDDKRYLRDQVDRHTSHGIEGILRIDRIVDTERGIVQAFDVELTGDITTKKGERFELEFRETWKSVAVRKNRDAKFRVDVVKGIQSSAAFLRDKCKNLAENSIKGGVSGKGEGRRSYGSGALALCTLAMIKGGIPKDDEVLAAALDALRSREVVDTYSLGCVLMAFEALYSPIGEREDLIAGIVTGPRIRKPSARDKELIERWTKILLQNIDTRTDRNYSLRFNYVRAGRFDTSVNQYGLLGMYAAQLCGVEISVADWRAAINHLVESQQEPTDATRLSLQSAGAGPAKSYRNTRAGGWGYYWAKNGSSGAPNPVYGSMTCAGITGLAVSQAGLRLAGFGRDAAIKKAQSALESGFAWMAKNFTVRWNPGHMQKAQNHVFYYLYGLERSCELAQVGYINDRDWYFEAAMTLLAMQRADGSWGADRHADNVRIITAMALLVLKKESMPVFTGGK